MIDVSSPSEQYGDRFNHVKTDTRVMQYSLSSILHNQPLCHSSMLHFQAFNHVFKYNDYIPHYNKIPWG